MIGWKYLHWAFLLDHFTVRWYHVTSLMWVFFFTALSHGYLPYMCHKFFLKITASATSLKTANITSTSTGDYDRSVQEDEVLFGCWTKTCRKKTVPSRRFFYTLIFILDQEKNIFKQFKFKTFSRPWVWNSEDLRPSQGLANTNSKIVF